MPNCARCLRSRSCSDSRGNPTVEVEVLTESGAFVVH